MKSIVKCLECQVEFEKENNQIKRSPNHFCSRSCAAKYNNKKYHKRQPKSSICRRCKVEFPRTDYKDRRTVCSECKSKSLIKGNSKHTDEELTIAIQSTGGPYQAAKYLGLHKSKPNAERISKFAQLNNIDVSHWTSTFSNDYRKGNHGFVKDSISTRTTIRRKILRYNLIPYECSSCGISTWKDKPLSLQLEHINGINNDHRIENLTFLCPNCHSQTETFCGKNKKN